jgi:hypothetical protein
LQFELNRLLNWFLDVRSKTLDIEGEHRALELASVIAAMATVLLEQLPAGDTTITKNVRAFDPRSYLETDQEYRRKVVDIHEYCVDQFQDELAWFFLHGSLATLDYSKGWSDVDTFLVIRNETLLHPDRLVRLRKKTFKLWPLLQAVTPLQHHGLIVSTEIDLSAYHSHFMPPSVFNHAYKFLGDQLPVTFQICGNGLSGALRNLLGRKHATDEALNSGVYKHHPHKGVYLEANFANAQDAMLQFFAFAGYVMTLPALFLDAISQSCYKKNSFDKARPYFSDRAWGIIATMSSVRAEWENHEYPAYEGNAIPNWVQKSVGPDYVNEFAFLLNEAIAHIKTYEHDASSIK